MNARQRINAVIYHQQPDQVPFAPLVEYVPRGEFTRALRNRGMGFMTRTRITSARKEVGYRVQACG
jgi:hypothetical protein